jgi:hypothetical protein
MGSIHEKNRGKKSRVTVRLNKVCIYYSKISFTFCAWVSTTIDYHFSFVDVSSRRSVEPSSYPPGSPLHAVKSFRLLLQLRGIILI